MMGVVGLCECRAGCCEGWRVEKSIGVSGRFSDDEKGGGEEGRGGSPRGWGGGRVACPKARRSKRTHQQDGQPAPQESRDHSSARTASTNMEEHERVLA